MLSAENRERGLIGSLANRVDPRMLAERAGAKLSGWMAQVSWGRVVRLLADFLILYLSVACALILRYLWWILVDAEGRVPRLELLAYLSIFRDAAWIVAAIGVALFLVSGFYTYGRGYHSRYKALIIVQAVTLTYLITGFFAFLFPEVVKLPRSVLLVSWAMSLLALLLSRLWSQLWRTIVHIEDRRGRPVQASDGRRHVLVIGGGGYIGSALLPILLRDGYRVRVLDLFLYGAGPIESVLNHPDVEFIKADFRQVDALVEAMRGVDQVVHLGGIVGDPACAIDEELTIDVNLNATRVIADVAKGQGVKRLVFASTCSVYGASDEILDERSVLNPVSLYARSKIASEKVLLEMTDHKFAPVILRFGTIYGQSGRTRFDLVVNLLVAKALVDGEITIFGGDQWRPFLHVEDAALAVAKFLRAPLALGRGEIFNVGSNAENYTIAQIGKIVNQAVPEAALVSSGSDDDKRNYRVRFDKIARTVNFKTKWTVEAGVRQVLEAMRSGEVTNYRDSLYSNAKFLGEEGSTLLVRRELDWAHHAIRQPAVPIPLVGGGLISTPLSADRRGPVERAEGADMAGFVEQRVPGRAAGVEDGVVTRPQAVREEALAQIQPDPLDGVELGRA
jgi:nucleoside-diphosphate-sugar epimerase